MAADKVNTQKLIDEIKKMQASRFSSSSRKQKRVKDAIESREPNIYTDYPKQQE